jgi:hypothetical protein
MSQGRAPECASSTIFCRVESGRGRPLTNTPPSWFTPLCPAGGRATNTVEQLQLGQEAGFQGFVGAESTQQNNYSQGAKGMSGNNGRYCNDFTNEYAVEYKFKWKCTAILTSVF